MQKITLVLTAVALSLGADPMPREAHAQQVQITPVVTGLDTPWGFDFLPDGGVLVTERDGRLLHVKDGRAQPVSGVPSVFASGQGGLLDVMVPRDFVSSREIFLSFSRDQGRGAGTAVAKARLSAAGDSLEGLEVIFESAPESRGGRHFGSRVVEARDGTLFVTMGDRGDPDTAQDRSLHNGSILRITRDGATPADNPFVGQAGIQPEIWSFGHRNPQGAGLDTDGTLWTAEHGARGGDEVNRIRKGANFGWPVISYGRNYSGTKIGEGVAKPGMEQPEYYWDPSIAPSGLMVYSGKIWPAWRGDIFVGSLKSDHIARLEGSPLQLVETLAFPETERVRDIDEAPDGAIWFLSEGQGALYRMTPGG
ncbi:PQQ-dependent sugar dehydrogenase [Sedimentitalea sp. CAU 1593]|uniref:PQQ-dependent sugar dehydrogenase n=2 Tax=Sedimentitalea arenosa TaxID=2798803 RepID=A0A8J7J7A9_9RHOB|nr:PQQ-dependent sugar dehydrogenase [Arenibacterium arenosum]